MRPARALLIVCVAIFMGGYVIEHAGVFASARDRDRLDLDLTTRRHLSPRLAVVRAAARAVVLGSSAGQSTKPPPLGPTLFAPRFPQSVGLVTNDFAYFNPTYPHAARSRDWIVTSGSLFARHGVGWSGVPDSATPNAHSSNGTGSATFRLVTRRRDFGNVAVSFDLKTERFVTTRRTPARSWDGIHIFLHYRSQHALYALAVNRRDGVVLVKKKRPGGPANGGTYFTIGKQVRYAPVLGVWQHVLAIITTAQSTVTISLYIDGRQLLSRTDTGSHGDALTAPGAVGIRGDNSEFEFRNFRVQALG
ncbi:MAG TPA: hypothetical protein VKR21_07475 [Solirubrobacteraceae bacterium]|nr:hypothetical protein [Solirubrobacteraceae bacterium]